MLSDKLNLYLTSQSHHEDLTVSQPGVSIQQSSNQQQVHSINNEDHFKEQKHQEYLRHQQIKLQQALKHQQQYKQQNNQ